MKPSPISAADGSVAPAALDAGSTKLEELESLADDGTRVAPAVQRRTKSDMDNRAVVHEFSRYCSFRMK
jgi:hypothetical protein